MIVDISDEWIECKVNYTLSNNSGIGLMMRLQIGFPSFLSVWL